MVRPNEIHSGLIATKTSVRIIALWTGFALNEQHRRLSKPNLEKQAVTVEMKTFGTLHMERHTLGTEVIVVIVDAASGWIGVNPVGNNT